MVKLIKGIETDIGIISAGSRIRFNDEDNPEYYGDIGTVTKICKTDNIFIVKWDDDSTSEENKNRLDDFELVK